MKFRPGDKCTPAFYTANRISLRLVLIYFPPSTISAQDFRCSSADLPQPLAQIRSTPRTAHKALGQLPFKQAVFHDILSHRQPEADLRVYSSLKRYGLLAEFVQAMEKTFSDVKEVDMIPYPDGTPGPVYVKTKDDRVLPMYAFGDGMRRWFYLLGNMTAFRNAVHCVEEIDSTMHPASQSQFCRLLAEYADKFKNQLFLTSHNIEFADAFLNALYGEGAPYESLKTDPARLITIRTNQGRPEVWSLRGREAFEKRKNFELELRG